MGSDALHYWGDNAAVKSAEQFSEKSHSFHHHGKKSYWHSTFGKIEAIESLFRNTTQLSRPFSYSSGLTARCCSMPLQRVIADFGAAHAFGQVPTKLQEHYSIQIPASTIRKITELHGQQMHEQRQV